MNFDIAKAEVTQPTKADLVLQDFKFDEGKILNPTILKFSMCNDILYRLC